MNPWQILQNLVWYLNPTQFVWPGTATPVLGRVSVTTDPATFAALDQVAPSVMIRAERTAAHPEHPADLEDEARWALTLYALNATDQAGGASVVGGNRAPGSVSSGRGLLELEPLVRAQVQQAFLAAGVRPRITAGPATVHEALHGLLAARSYEVLGTRFPVQRCYANVTRLKATLAGGTTLAWTPAPLTWNLVAYQVVRKNGGVPPANPTDGTVLTSTLAPTATGYVDAGGGAGKAYSVFGVFDDTKNPFDGKRDPSLPTNAYSGYSTPQNAFVYQPASVTT
jgi:hypothetical protein